MVKVLLQKGADPEPTACLQLQGGMEESITPGRLAQLRGHGSISTSLLAHVCQQIKQRRY